MYVNSHIFKFQKILCLIFFYPSTRDKRSTITKEIYTMMLHEEEEKHSFLGDQVRKMRHGCSRFGDLFRYLLLT